MRPRVRQRENTFCEREWVEEYDEIAQQSMAPVFAHFARCIEKTGINRGRVLELGSGTGRLFLALAARRGLDFELVGIDISREMATRARENSRGARLEASFPLASASRLPFRESSFDLVISSSSLHMWSEPVGVFNEVRRVLKPGGLCLIRDGRRLPDNLFWRIFIGLSARIRAMNGRQRKAWQSAIAAGYTLEEARELLRSSRLRHWKVKTDRMIFELVIEARKETA